MNPIFKAAWEATKQYRQEQRLDPIEGRCTECSQFTEDRYDGFWLCKDCNDQLNKEYEQNCKLDDPRHGQTTKRLT